jgi:hypothetical protein
MSAPSSSQLFMPEGLVEPVPFGDEENVIRYWVFQVACAVLGPSMTIRLLWAGFVPEALPAQRANTYCVPFGP